MNALRFFAALALLGFPAGAALAQLTTINVEIDYMVDTDHSHMPSGSEILAVKQMFACQGITLNFIIDDALTHRDVLRRDPGNNNNFFGYNNGDDTFGGIKAANFDQGAGWHYAVFGHQYQDTTYVASGSSGLGEQPGDDFVVTLGTFTGEVGTAWDRAATFAHELGHNLGLGHAGLMDPSVVGTDVPNVPSIMTYFTQLLGVRTALQCNDVISDTNSETLFKELDFSHGRACGLNEASLVESRGMVRRVVEPRGRDGDARGELRLGGGIVRDVG
jgi:hypothetical protein